MLTRRAALFGAGLAGLSGLALWRGLGVSQADGIKVVLDKRLDYLTLDPAGVDAFAADLIKRGYINANGLRFVSAVRPLYRSVSFGHGRIGEAFRRGEERIASMFLMSSDFFVNGADVNRTVRYLGFYDALERPCSSPFARLA